MGNKQKIVLNLDASYKVKHEKYKSFSRSFFKNVYQQAAKNVKEIIDTTKSDFAYEGHKEYTEPISSLITFDGKRGSGKTSAMLSFCDFLRDFNRIDVDEKGICGDLFNLNSIRKGVSFTVLECIDATLVTDSKELMGAILGKMHTAIRERENSNTETFGSQDVGVRKLKTRLGEIYCSLKSQDIVREDTSPGEVLEQLSRSWNQQQAFRDAVQKFNNYMSPKTDSSHENYLVIPIDDVDMNLDNGYELLEAIRKYMMVPNVIVLLAADDEQLETICVSAYRKGISKKKDSGLSHRLALEYLEKLIPSGRRIYMPDLYREENLYDKDVYIKQEDGYEQTVKNTILLNVWKYTGIILNKDYENSHWLQPQSLRKLSNYVNAMRSLSEQKASGTEESPFYHNINWFYEDLVRRYLNDGRGKYSDKYRKQALGAYIEALRGFENVTSANKLQRLREGLVEYTYTFNSIFNNNMSLSLYNYGDMIVFLYLFIGDGKFLEIYQATSFILSLQMRRIIFSIEDSEDNQKGYEELLQFSKGDLWGKTDQVIWLEPFGKSQQRYKFECEVDVELLVNAMVDENKVFIPRNLMMLAMQLDLYEDEQGKYKGSFRFGNFVNCVFDYNNRITKFSELLKRSGKLTKYEEKMIEDIAAVLINEFDAWKNKYKTTRVIPFDSVEFMFAIFDKLYGSSGVFQAFESGAQYVEMYKDALDTIAETLGSYDDYYKDIRNKNALDGNDVIMNELKKEWSYKEVYEYCPFIKYMKEQDIADSVIPYYIGLFKNSTASESNPRE